MPELTCLRCKKEVDASLDACPHCQERITNFQRTYSSKLIDGKYQILERLGMGGMGEIFKVRHIHLGEERVIKIMRANIASDEQALQRFLYEARTSTMIKHRNLAMLYDFSTLEDGSYYMVWEYIDGTNIQKWMAANGPVPSRLALEIAIQTLQGLDHLHQMGLIHRDISPENIMLSQDHQGKLLVKVIDFGIAKQLSESGPGSGLTQTGMFLGKLKYASPEQAGFIKEGETLDARSDLYSFGVVFYEMLAGRAPFVATNPQGYILKHATEQPPAITQVNPQASVPAELEEQVLIALAKERDDRHHSAADFAADLEDLRSVIPLGDDKFAFADPKTGSGKAITERSRGGLRTGSARTGAGSVSGSAATLVDTNTPTIAASQLSGEQPTLADRTREADVATVVERAGLRPVAVPPTIAVPAPGRRNTALYAAIAVLLLLVLAAGGYFMFKPEEIVVDTAQPQISPTPGPTSIEVATGQEGFVLMANPHGELERVVDAKTKKPVLFDAPEGRETPVTVKLPPGEYEVVVAGPEKLEQKTVSITVRQGELARSMVHFTPLDLEKISSEILTPR